VKILARSFPFITGRGRRFGNVGEDFGEVLRFAAGGAAGVARTIERPTSVSAKAPPRQVELWREEYLVAADDFDFKIATAGSRE
jgi:hypothetical protein